MEDTRVTFETAKLAKGKGFPQETNRLEIPYYNYKGEFKGDVSDWRVRKYIRGEDTSDIEFVSAPTQSLLAKWLREEHDINVTILISGTDYHQYVLHGKNRKYIKTVDNPITYENYKNNWEDTLEKGLQEALKLI